MDTSASPRQRLTCSNCGAVWQKHGTTNCWSNPANRAASPAYCPTTPYGETIRDAFEEYTGDVGDARLARMAAKVVEGLCDAIVEVTETGSAPRGSSSTR